jgi:HEXXH motif-containing protein
MPDPMNTGRAFSHHYISRDSFDALATSERDADAVESLVRAERSLRLLMLRILMDTADEQPDVTGPLPPLDDAWMLLAAA